MDKLSKKIKGSSSLKLKNNFNKLSSTQVNVSGSKLRRISSNKL